MNVPNRVLVLALASLGSACMSTPASGPALVDQGGLQGGSYVGRPRGTTTIHLGGRALDDDTFYDPVDQPIALGFEYAQLFEPEGALGWETGFFLAIDDDDVMGVDVSSFFLELDLGIRAEGDSDPFVLFAGAGFALVLAEIEVASSSDEDFTLGPYVHAGAGFKLDEQYYLGIDVRSLFATEVQFDGFVESDADYLQVSLVFGWRR